MDLNMPVAEQSPGAYRHHQRTVFSFSFPRASPGQGYALPQEELRDMSHVWGLWEQGPNEDGVTLASIS